MSLVHQRRERDWGSPSFASHRRVQPTPELAGIPLRFPDRTGRAATAPIRQSEFGWRNPWAALPVQQQRSPNDQLVDSIAVGSRCYQDTRFGVDWQNLEGVLVTNCKETHAPRRIHRTGPGPWCSSASVTTVQLRRPWHRVPGESSSGCSTVEVAPRRPR